MRRFERPPRLAGGLLRSCVSAHRRDEVAADLAELFALRVQRVGRLRAHGRYWLDVLSVCARARLRREQPGRAGFSHPRDVRPSLLPMLSNYLKLALRNVRRHPGHTALHVANLAIGLASCLLIALYVQDERSYDRHHAQAGRIYRAALDLTNPAGTDALATSPAAFAPLVREAFPEVEQAVRLVAPFPSASVRYEDQLFLEPRFFMADPEFFDVFTLPLVRGTAATALAAPFQVVVTEQTARRYFGTSDPVGRMLTVNDTLRFTVTGVLRDLPEQSHLAFDFLASFATWEAMFPGLAGRWAPQMYHTYLLLRPGTTGEALEARLPDLVARHVELPEGWAFTFHLQPLLDIHLRSHRTAELQPNGHEATLYVFSTAAVLILLLACVNFTNMSTARSMQRAKEIGMRKVLGAYRVQLAAQFLGEAVLLTFAALAAGLALSALVLPVFNALAGKSLSMAAVVRPPYVLALPALTLGVGLLAGGYPAFVLSGFRPLTALKPGATGERGRYRLREALVVFQFAVSIVLLAGASVVHRQLAYMRAQDLGFSAEQVVVVPSLQGYQLGAFETLRQALAQHPGVVDVAASSVIPGRTPILLSYHAEGMPDGESHTIQTIFADAAFVGTYGMEIVAGRDFSDAFATDSAQGFLLNETAVADLGWTPEEAVGKRFTLRGEGRVLGVVRDFHYASLQQPVEPVALVPVAQVFGNFPLLVSLRLRAGDLPATLAAAEQTWKTVFPSRPFAYTFVDDEFARQYRSDEQFGRISLCFAALSVLIAALGLFGLAAFAAGQRTKEIGVRKVLGASAGSIVWLLDRDFARLVVVALVVAAPVVYVAGGRWLEGFAYRIDVPWWTVPAAGLAALAVALLTVSYHAVRAAQTDPIKTLRHE